MHTPEDPAQNVEQAYRLSPLQEGILFHCLRSSDPGLYLEQLFFDLRDANFDPDRFTHSCRTLVRDHAPLRTAFAWRELREPLQIVGRDAELSVETEDWRASSPVQQAAAFAELLRRDRARGFDLTAAPLIRFTLLRLDADCTRVLISNHHLILDGWSRGILISRLLANYQNDPAGSAAPTNAPPYNEFVTHARNQNLEGARDFWNEKLRGFEQSTPVPGDHSETNPTQTINDPNNIENETETPGIIDYPLDRQIQAGLDQFAREQGLTQAAVTQAAWALLIANYTGSDDILFGTTFAGRPTDFEHFESMVGLFINTLPLRLRPRHSQSVLDLCRQAQTELNELRQHELTPLTRIQEWSAIRRGDALFDCVFAFESLPGVKPPAGATFTTENFTSDSRSHYPLSVAYLPGTTSRVQFAFDPTRLSPEQIKRIAGHYARLLEELPRNPQAAPDAVPMLTPEEIQNEFLNFNPPSGPRSNQSLDQLFEEVAREYPDQIALDFSDAKFTYAELDRSANRIAGQLIQAGVQPGEPVALFMERSAAFVTTLLGLVKAGAPYVPLDPEQPDARTQFMLADCGARILISDDSHPTPQNFTGRVISFAELSSQASNSNATNEDSANSPNDNTNEPSGETPLYIMYTSGSTGQPRGIVVPHRAVERLVRATNYIDIQSIDTVGQAANAAFDAATFEIWGALLNGARLAGLPRDVLLQTDQLAANLKSRGISILFLTTALFNLISRDAPDAFASLRVLLFGGEQADPAAARRVLDGASPRELLHVYGPTECTTFALFHRLTHVAAEADFLPVGQPIGETAAFILHPATQDHLRPAPPGVVGEICLAGRGLALEYHGLPALSAEKFPEVQSQWNQWADQTPGLADRCNAWPRIYRTGDLGRRLADGSIQCLGRNDFQIKLRGFRIEPGEIEAALRACPGIANALVMLDAQRSGEDARLVAHIEWTGAKALSENELRMFLGERLPEQMVPAVFIEHAQMPLTASGKIDRAALKKNDIQTNTGSNNPANPTTAKTLTDLERLLRDLWQEVLERDTIQITDGFFELGGHSLLAVRLVSRINEALLIDLPLPVLLEALTIEKLARVLRARPAGEELEDRARIYLEVAGLSEEEVERRLNQETV